MTYKSSHQVKILQNRQIGERLFDLRVHAPQAAGSARAGQFVNLSVPNGYLRRPISICDVEGETIRLVYEIKGPGLFSLSEMGPGESVNLLGPLGNGFRWTGEEKNAYVVGGGIGVFPLLLLAKQLPARAVLGFRSAAQVCLTEEFASVCTGTEVATDDGSVGTRGNVCDVLKKRIEGGDRPDQIFACGPKPMLQALAALAEEYGIPAQLSLEERMACGVGACLGCAVKVRAEGGWEYRHVCKDGPVFDAGQVIFD